MTYLFGVRLMSWQPNDLLYYTLKQDNRGRLKQPQWPLTEMVLKHG